MVCGHQPHDEKHNEKPHAQHSRHYMCREHDGELVDELGRLGLEQLGYSFRPGEEKSGSEEQNPKEMVCVTHVSPHNMYKVSLNGTQR